MNLLKCLGLKVSTQLATQKETVRVVLGNRKISAVKHSLEKTILLNFVTCPRYFVQGCLRN